MESEPLVRWCCTTNVLQGNHEQGYAKLKITLEDAKHT
jgi:hypothetical protein